MPRENSNVNEKRNIFIPDESCKQKTVLLVDDEEQIKELLIMIFEKAGYMVLTAASVKEATNLFTKNEESIELLVTDFSLEESNGYELAKLLKVKKNKLYVLLMSGNPNWLLDETDIRESGFGIIEKPFDVNQLFEKIRELKEHNSNRASNKRY